MIKLGVKKIKRTIISNGESTIYLAILELLVLPNFDASSSTSQFRLRHINQLQSCVLCVHIYMIVISDSLVLELEFV